MPLIKDKHLKLDQDKIDEAKRLLNVKTETEAIEKALELLISTTSEKRQKQEIVKHIMELREAIGPIKEDVANWIREGRKENIKKWKRLLSMRALR